MKIGKPLFLAAAVVAGTAALFAAKAAPKPAPHAASAAVQRGKYLVSVLACNDCHTPKKMGPNGPEIDMTKMLIGYVGGELSPAPASGPWIAHTTDQFTAWSGPWGISYAKNLTPDENTGIGSWSEETFVKAIRTGKHMGVSRPILPPMPWNVYVNLTDADLKAVYAYLRTLPPVHNPQPDPTPPPAAPAGK
ncbi:MAG TPA: c-type cytochrome [Thermoanaerobaculia bacterium]|nr:c-type cytochrome [Thermoanaerobaculia bacterium]